MNKRNFKVGDIVKCKIGTNEFFTNNGTIRQILHEGAQHTVTNTSVCNEGGWIEIDGNNYKWADERFELVNRPESPLPYRKSRKIRNLVI